MTRKILSIMLVIAMAATLFPAAVLAADTEKPFIETTGFPTDWTNVHSDVTITAKDAGSGVASMTVNGIDVPVAGAAGGSAEIQPNGTPYYKLKQISYDENTKVLTLGVFLGNVQATAGKVAFKYDTSKLAAYDPLFEEAFGPDSLVVDYFVPFSRSASSRDEYGITADALRKTKNVTLITTAPDASTDGSADLDVQNGVGYIVWNTQEVLDATEYELPILKFAFLLKDSVTLSDLNETTFLLPEVRELNKPVNPESASLVSITVNGEEHRSLTSDKTLVQAYTVNGQTYGDGRSEGEYVYKGSTADAVDNKFVVEVTDKEGNVYQETIPVLVDTATRIDRPTFDVSVLDKEITVSNVSVARTPLSGVTYMVQFFPDNGAMIDSKPVSENEEVHFTGEEGKTYKILVIATSGTGVESRMSKFATIEARDITPPEITISGNPVEWTNSDVTILIQTNEPTTIFVNGEIVAENAESANYTVEENAELIIKAVDKAGNEATETVVVDKIDKVAPKLISLEGNLANWTNKDIVFTLTTDEACEIQVDGQVLETNATSAQFTAEENKTYVITLTDAAGNQRIEKLVVTNIDKATPEITISGNPVEWTNSDATILIQTNEPATIFVNGEIVAEDAVSASYLVKENAEFIIKAVDKAGNEATETVVVDKIDKEKPYITITGEPTAPCQEAELAISATDDLSDVQSVTVNGIDITNETSYLVTENGEYKFVVTDNAGNTESYTVTITWIDNERPVIIDSYDGAAGWTKDAISIDITVDKACTILLNGEEIGTDTTTAQFVATENGSYEITAVDEAGNKTVKTIVVTNIDNAVPQVRVEMDSEWAIQSTVVIYADDGEGSGIQSVMLGDSAAALDNGAYKVVLEENGTYVLTVTDKAGNVYTDEVTVQNVDKDAPVLVIPEVPEGIFKTFDLTVEASDAQSGLKAVTVNGTEVDGDTYTVTENGTYVFVAEDNVGNRTTVVREVSNIDNIAPKLISVEGNFTKWTNKGIVFTITADEACEIRMGNLVLGTNTTSAEFTAEANKTFIITLTDAVGNQSTEKIVVTNIDKNAPEAIVTVPTEWVKNGKIVLQVSDVLSGVKEVSINGTVLTGDNGSYEYPVTENGTYSFTLADNAGNTTVKEVVVDKIDAVAPTLEVTVDNTVWAKSREIAIAYADDKSGIAAVTVNGEAFSGTVYTATANGSYEIIATDNAGNQTKLTVVVENVDNTAPVFDGEIAVTATTADSITVALPLATDENVVSYKLFLNDEEVEYEQTKTFAGLAGGTIYTVKLIAADGAENETVITKEITTAATGSIVVAIDVTGISAEAPLKMTATVNGVTKEIGADGKALFENLIAGKYTVLIEGNGYVSFEKTDVEVAGKQETVVSVNTATEFLAGDVNGNRVIDIYDLNAVASNFTSGKYTDEKLIRFDFNRDGLINAADVEILVRSFTSMIKK